jgi:hypothetical protein
MKLPDFFYILAFWQALAYVIAAIVAAFTPYKLEAGILLALILAVLKMFQIEPELRIFRLNRLLNEKGTHRTDAGAVKRTPPE